MRRIKLLFCFLLLSMSIFAIDVKKTISATETNGGTLTILSSSQNQILRLTGSPTLTGNYSVKPDGSENGSMTLFVENLATPTLSGGHVYLFGTQVPDELASKKWTANCICTSNGVWQVTITPSFVETDIVSATNIIDTCITASQLKSLSVTTTKIAVSAITSGRIATGAVTSAKIDTMAVTTGKIAELGVTTAKINDLGVTTGKIAANAVTTAKVSTDFLPDPAGSVTQSSAGYKLSGDVQTPGSSYHYGTNSSGIKGWYADAVLSEVKLSISTANVKTLYSSPLQLIANPGVGKAIIIEDAFISTIFASAKYVTDTTLNIITETADIPQFQGIGLLQSTKDEILFFKQYTGIDKSQIISNKAVLITTPSANPTVGGSNIVIYCRYRIVTL